MKISSFYSTITATFALLLATAALVVALTNGGSHPKMDFRKPQASFTSSYRGQTPSNFQAPSLQGNQAAPNSSGNSTQAAPSRGQNTAPSAGNTQPAP